MPSHPDARPLVWLLLVPLAIVLSLAFSPVPVVPGAVTQLAVQARDPFLRPASKPAPTPREAVLFKPKETSSAVAATAMDNATTAAPTPTTTAPATETVVTTMVGGTTDDHGTAEEGATDEAATAATAPVLDLPVMDVVYAVNLPNDTDFFRIDYGDIEALFAETAKQLNGSQVRFHLLSNDDEAIRRMTAVQPDLRVHDYRALEAAAGGGGSDRSRAFLQHYVHQSANPMEMERLCIWRWILMADYFQGLRGGSGEDGGGLEDLQYILGIDTDVALFQHPARLLSEWKLAHWADKGFECHQVANGAAMLWSPQGLDNFADFVAEAYATPEAAAEHVQAWGERFPFCRPERSLLLPCDPQAATPEMWHMSDMDLLRAWFLQDSTRRTRKEEERCLVVRQARKASGFRMWVDANTNANTEATTTAAAKPTLMGIMPTPGPAGAPRVTEEPEEVCMVHFQGPQSKKLIAPFRAFVERNEAAAAAKQGEKEEKKEEFVLPYVAC